MAASGLVTFFLPKKNSNVALVNLGIKESCVTLTTYKMYITRKPNRMNCTGDITKVDEDLDFLF